MKSKILLRIVLLFVGITCGTILNAQEIQGQTYAITSNGSVTDIQPYIAAMNKADMKYHRLKNARHTITFNTGVKVEIFSASEINTAVRSLNLSEYPENFEANALIPVFSLGPNNFIMEERKVTGKHY